jgi:thymidylate kinase
MIDLLEKSNYPIIVLEGPDGVGKTSLGLALQQHLGARYIHLTYRFRNKMDVYHYAAIRLCAHLAQKQPVILDRWWISEILYAEAYRGGSPFIKRHFLLEHIANAMGLTYVVCLPEDREQYLKHYMDVKQSRSEAELARDPPEGVEKVYDLYVDFYKTYMGLKENVMRYDVFSNFYPDKDFRDIAIRSTCQKIFEFTEDYRSTL